MEDSQDADLICLDPVENLIRKSANETATNVLVNALMEFWERCDEALMSDGVLVGDVGSFQVMVAGGSPTLNPTGNLIDFQDPVMNGAGMVGKRCQTKTSREASGYGGDLKITA